MAYNEEVTMMMSVVPGAMTGISAMMGGLASITNVFTDVTRQIDAKFGLIDATIVTASTVVAQFGFEAANAFGEFEQGLKIAQMVSNQTAQDMDYLRNKANEFSVSYRTDIDQITEGLQTLGRAGLNSASEQTEVLKEGLSTAKLESRDLNGVLEELIQNTALLGGNLKESNFGEDSKYVNDLLVATSMTAPITTHDVSETLKYSGGIAAAAGAQIRDEAGNVNEEGKKILEDYMGAIAAFAQKGVTGSIAGTALRAFFNKPATQDSSVKDALASIKLKPEYLWEDDEQTMKPVSEQIAIIKNQMEDLNVSTMDQLQIWSKIVGGKMGQQMMKLDSSDIKELTKDIQSANDAESLAAGTFKTYQSQLKETTEQGQVAFRQFGEYAAKVLTPLLKVLKVILEIFSNPVVSGIAFVGAFSLIASAIRRAKDMLSAFTKELQTFRHYMTTGENLWAMRPSTVRKNNRTKNRFTEENLAQKYPGMSSITAFSREKRLEADEKLLAKGFSMEEIDIMRAGSKLSGKDFLGDRKFSSLKINKNSEIVDFLLKEGEWKKEFSETYYQYGNLKKVFEVHRDEIMSILDDYNKKAKEASSTTSTPTTIQEKKKEIEDNQKKIRDANREKFKNGEFSLLAENISFFPEEEMWKEVSRAKTDLKNRGKTYAHNNVAFDTARQSIIDRYASRYAAQIIALLPSAASNYTTGDTTKGTPSYIIDPLIEGGYLPDKPDIINSVRKSFIEQAEEQKTRFLETQYKKLQEQAEETKIPMSAIALSNRAGFASYTKDIKLDSTVSPEEFQKYVLERSLGITTARQASNATKSMLPGFGPSLTPYDIEKIFFFDRGDYDSKEHKRWQKEQGKDDFFLDGGYYGRDADKKEEDRAKADENRRKAEKRLLTEKEMNERLQSIRNLTFHNMIDNFVPDIENYNLKELSATNQSALNKISKGKEFLSIKDMREIIKDVYGKDVELPARNRLKAAQNALPYFMDWNLGKNEGGITKEDFAKFAKETFDVTLDSRQTRAAMVGTLETELFADKIDDYFLNRQIQGAMAHSSYILPSEFYNAVKEEQLGKIQYEGEILAIDQERLKLEEEMLLMNKRNKNDYRNAVKPEGPDLESLKKANLVEQARKEFDEENRKRDNLFAAHKVKADTEKAKKDFGYDKYAELEDYYIKKAQADYFEELSRQRLGARKKLGLPFQEAYNGPRATYDIEKVPTGKHPDEDPDKTLKAYGIETKNRGIQDKIRDFFRIDKDGKNIESSSKLKKFSNGLSKAADLVGGKFFASLEIASLAASMWQQEFEKYCQSLKNASQDLKKAYSERDTAESSLRQSFKNENPDITDEELDAKMLDTYKTMGEDIKNAVKNNDSAWLSKLGQNTKTSPEYEYDEEAADGTLKVKEEELTESEEHTKAIKENTGALYAAAYKVTQALDNYVRISQDSWWGTDGWVSKLTDGLGEFLDRATHYETLGSTFSGNGNQFLLTASQQDENYSGYTEMAGLMLEDFKDANGDWIAGMETMMGEDAISLSRALGGKNSDTGKYLTKMAQFSAGQGIGGLDSFKNAKIQQSMKNDPKLWKNLGKELAKRDTNKKLGRDITKNQNRIKLLTQQIRQTVGSGFKASQIQRAAYIQQLQDMKAIADQAIVPIMQTNLGIAGQTLSAAGSTESNTKNTTSATGATNNNAAIIAGLVAVIARQSAKQEFFDQVLAGGEEGDSDMDGTKGTEADKELYKRATEDGMTADKFYQQNAADYNEYLKTKGSLGTSHDKATRFDWMETNNKDKLTAGMKGYLSLIEATAKMTGYDYDKMAAKDKGREFSQDMIDRGVSLLDAFSIVDQNYTMSEGFKDAITNAYLMAQDEGEGSDVGGSGSGDKDKDNDNGTRKERVDLVLCNRKTIPKLNVNLFKKPPSFTILNKNFKLRDVKINSEDKPKAIMAAIKNSFIDIQKRTDPKIIQDEDAVYDPAAATDGTNVPSGSAKTNTS